MACKYGKQEYDGDIMLIDFYSEWPFFGCLAILLLIVSTPYFSSLDSPPNPHHMSRISNLDGLRGFLAFGVFFHHQAMDVKVLKDGVFALPPSQFYATIGPLGVEFFFMITGFLFWGKLIEEGGKPDWLRLYIGRAFRIGPLYLFALSLVLLVVAFETELSLKEGSLVVASEVLKSLLLGNFFASTINGYWTGQLIGPTWSLPWEWKFYYCLPVLSIFARHGRPHLLFAVSATLCAVLILTFSDSDPSQFALSKAATLFLLGILCGSLKKQFGVFYINNFLSSCLVIAVLTMLIWTSAGVYSIPTILLGAVAFFLITVGGCDVFGLLTSRPAKRLGDISYSIYLLQAILVGAVFAFAPIRRFDIASPLNHWVVACLCSILLLLVSALTFNLIERQGIETGRKIVARLKGPSLGLSKGTPQE
jgi:peptidoglycan/LPS O-acetylase OafA/YrhL